MSVIKTILVPTDFSDASRHALRYACSVAEALGASLHILHTVETVHMAAGYMELYPPPQEYFDELEKAARTNLAESLSADEKQRFRAAFVLRSGSPAQEILAYLNEHNDIDLVVMATHGRGGVARLMMGSVADKVLRAAPCPVLTLREFDRARSGQVNPAA
jgi:universal stress protein A